MRLFGKNKTETTPIQVSLDVRAFVEGRMVRVSVDVQACEGDRLKGLLKRLRREGTLERSLVRLILQGNPGVTLLRNGSRLHMPQAASVHLTDGDTLAVLTPAAGG